jgi:ribosomal protein S8
MANVYNKKHKIFFLSLKTAYQKKQRFFTYFSKNPKLIIILKKLQEKSLIQGFYQTNVSQLQIFLRYDMNSLPAINNIFLFPKCKYISLKTLKAFQNDYFLSFSLLNTKFGILDMEECKKKNCGGELLVTIK